MWTEKWTSVSPCRGAPLLEVRPLDGAARGAPALLELEPRFGDNPQAPDAQL
jgi:hypothetical protein